MKTLIFILMVFESFECFGQDSSSILQDSKFIRDSSALFKEITEMHKEDQRIRSIKNANERNKQITFSGHTNTTRLIEMLNEYGYPSKHRFHTPNSKDVPVVVLFDHADMSSSDTLLKLLTREKTLNRVNSNEFELIKWHLNGRVGVPNISDTNGIKVKKRKKWFFFKNDSQ